MYYVYLAVLACSFPFLRIRFTSHSERVLVLIWLCLYICLGTFAYFADDYEPYAMIVELANLSSSSVELALEPFWIWLAHYTKGDIDLYRFLAFTIMAVLLFFIHKAARIEMKYLVVYYTFFCMMTHFTGVRQGLNFLLCLEGMLLCFNRRWILGLACVFLSSFLHKSGIMFALLLPFAMLPISRKTILLYLLALPILNVAFYALLNSSSTASSVVMLQIYAERENEFVERHILIRLLNWISELCTFLILFLTTVYFHKSDDRIVVLLTRCLFGLLVVAIFFFCLPIDTNVIYKRLLWFGMLIVAIVWGKCIHRNLVQKRFLYLLLLLYLAICIAMKFGNYHSNLDALARLPF